MPFAIGKRQDNYVYFDGMVKDVRLYSRVLAPTEIEGNARDGVPAETDGLVREWKLIESQEADWVAEIAEKAGLQAPYRDR